MKLNYKEIGERIKSRRKQLDMTQKQLANIIDLSEGSISRYEHGKVEDATLNVFDRFSKALNVETSWLIGLKKQSIFETRIKSIMLKAQQIPDDVLLKLLDNFEANIDVYLELNK